MLEMARTHLLNCSRLVVFAAGAVPSPRLKMAKLVSASMGLVPGGGHRETRENLWGETHFFLGGKPPVPSVFRVPNDEHLAFIQKQDERMGKLELKNRRKWTSENHLDHQRLILSCTQSTNRFCHGRSILLKAFHITKIHMCNKKHISCVQKKCTHLDTYNAYVTINTPTPTGDWSLAEEGVYEHPNPLTNLDTFGGVPRSCPTIWT